MKKYLLSTVAVLSALTMATASFAGQANDYHPGDHMYVRVDGGYSIGMGQTDNAGVFDAGVGMRLNQYFRADVMAEYRPWGKEEFKTKSDKAIVGKADMYSLDAMANIYALYPIMDGVSVYGTGGVGIAFNKTDKIKGSHNGASKTDFAWNVGAGMEYALTDCMAIDLGYRFTDLGKAHVKTIADNQKLKDKVRYNDIKVGFKYFF